jgi:hypothetical protein
MRILDGSNEKAGGLLAAPALTELRIFLTAENKEAREPKAAGNCNDPEKDSGQNGQHRSFLSLSPKRSPASMRRR